MEQRAELAWGTRVHVSGEQPPRWRWSVAIRMAFQMWTPCLGRTAPEMAVERTPRILRGSAGLQVHLREVLKVRVPQG